MGGGGGGGVLQAQVDGLFSSPSKLQWQWKQVAVR